MIQYAIATTLIAVAAVGAAITIFRRGRKRLAEVAAELNEAIAANQTLQKEIRKQRHIIKREQEVIRETAEKKREIRNHSDPGDRANAATDLMSKLAGGGDGD